MSTDLYVCNGFISSCQCQKTFASKNKNFYNCYTSNMDEKARKLKTALSMHTFGMQLKKQQIRRRNPDLPETEINKIFSEWVQSRDEHWPKEFFTKRERQ